MALERSQTTEKIKHYLFEKEHKKALRHFWEIVDQSIPGHSYEYLGVHPKTGLFELRQHLPFTFDVSADSLWDYR